MKLPNACDSSVTSRRAWTHMLHPLWFPGQQYTENNMSGRERSREGVRSAENSEKIKRGEEADKYDTRLSVCKLQYMRLDLVFRRPLQIYDNVRYLALPTPLI